MPDRAQSSKRVWLDRLGTFLLALILAMVVWVVATQQENPVVTVLIVS